MSDSRDPKKSSSGGLPLRWPPLITDDAGTPRRLLVLVTSDAELRQLMARLSSHLARRLFDRNSLIVTFLLLIGLLIPGLIAVELLLNGTRAARYVLFTGVGIVFAAGSILIGRRQVMRDSGNFVATLLAMGRCGCCGYQLDELPVDAEGMSTCPECGAQWQAKRIGGAAGTDAPRMQVGAAGKSANHLAQAHREVSAVFAPWSGRRTAVDARGRIIEVVRDPLLRRHHAALGAAERTRLEAALREASIPRRRANAIMLLCCAVFPLALAAGVIADLALAGQWIDLGSAVVIAACMAFAIWMIVYALRLLTGRTGYDTNGIVAALLQVQRCPSCGDELRMDASAGKRAGETIGDDAVRPCRGCGAAW